jgi:hypothetical protein
MKSNRTHKARNSRYEVLIMLNRPLVINPKPVSAIADIRVPFTKPDKPCLILVYFVCLFLGWKCSKSSDQVE